MKQIVQDLSTGETAIVEVPVPLARPRAVLVQTTASAVSSGTERQMTDFARKSLLGKAMERPDLVRKVVAAARAEGLAETFRQVRGRLDSFRPLGYSSSGVVVDVGPGVRGFDVGDRVACSGSGFACHAEYVLVPQTLCAPLPDGVGEDEAAFSALGAIALHALRLAELELGNRVVIIGLGLLGLMAVQIAKAWGCQVLGIDVAAGKADLASRLGVDQAVHGGSDAAVSAAQTLFAGRGADSAVIFASSPDNEPLELASELLRVRGRIVVPGLVGLDVPRRVFYEKELDLKVSRAWGPGLYDPAYEEEGRDYPPAFVRWTAGRNMEAFLHLVAQQRVRIQPLISHRFPIERATEAYQLITDGKDPYVGILLTYAGGGRSLGTDGWAGTRLADTVAAKERRLELGPAKPVETSAPPGRQIAVGMIGAGNFAKATLLPAMRRLSGVQFRGVATGGGASARHVGQKFGFAYCTTDSKELLDDGYTEVIFITTRHHTHARLAVQALRANKHVFVEKPLALNEADLLDVARAYREREAGSSDAVRRPPVFMVGFNRRFSPFSVALKQWLSFSNAPMVIHCRVNAGFVPPERWEQDPEVGGGRIVGEMCHFIDLIQYLTGASPSQVFAQSMRSAAGYLAEDNLVVSLQMSDGSAASILYTASGDKAFPRERIEVFRDGAVGLIDNFRLATFTRRGRTQSKRNLLGLDRGHRAELETFFAAVRKGYLPSPLFSDYLLTTLTTFAIVRSLTQGEVVRVQAPSLEEPKPVPAGSA